VRVRVESIDVVCNVVGVLFIIFVGVASEMAM